MSGSNRAAAWMYKGVWGALVRWFRVPTEPPELPVNQGEYLDSFQPDLGFLRYLKFWFWLLLWPMDIAIAIGMVAIFATVPWLGWILLVPALVLAILPDVLVYIGLHLRYDTTWYVMTNRSLRIRRGIWVIHEVTITFENVQNVKLQQGPLQRHYGFANLIVETAGAGGGQHQKGASGITNRGMIEGIANAHELRDRIMQRLKQSKSAGLGDEETHRLAGESEWNADHVAALREIRQEVRLLAASR